MNPIIGDTLHYRLTAQDAEQQGAARNRMKEGDIVTLHVTGVHGDGTVSGNVEPDSPSCFVFHIAGVTVGRHPGAWCWPDRN